MLSALDIVVIVAYLLALLWMGYRLSQRVNSADDMFTASNEVPWWMSGLSAYMTMFSSGTFVIWGGIAFKYGFVAVSICMTHGLAALIAGYFISARWRALGVSSVGEFVRLRFGNTATHAFTWLNLLSRIIGVSVSVYAMAVLLTALIEVPIASLFSDGNGKLSVQWGVLIVGVVVVGYTVLGGLWAVLLTDVLQFIVLIAVTSITVPLLFSHMGGINAALSSLPTEHFNWTTDDYPFLFLAGWTTLVSLKIGGEWAFVQRSLCVRTPIDAKKANLLFGVVYLITPIFWMLPPLLYAGINSGANQGQAYILAVSSVLPVGLSGVMLAAMFSATASMADSEINVFSGAITETYKRFKQSATDKDLVRVGRIFTSLLGIAIIGLCLLIPKLGGVERLVLSGVSLLVGPMIMPVIWSLLSKRISLSAFWIVIAISFSASFILKYILPGSIDSQGFIAQIAQWVDANKNLSEQVSGLLLPFITLSILEIRGRVKNRIDKGWSAIESFRKKHGMSMDTRFTDVLPTDYSNYTLIGGFIIAIACFMALIALFALNDKSIIFVFAAGLLLIGIPIYRKGKIQPSSNV